MALKVTKTIPTVATVVTTPIVARWGSDAKPKPLTLPMDDMGHRQALDAHAIATTLHQFFDRAAADAFTGRVDPLRLSEYDTEVGGQ